MEQRLKFFQQVTRFALGILILQCFNLQIVHYRYYRDLVNRNCIRTIELGTPRGQILDRNGRVLAFDRPCYNLVFVPYDLKDSERVARLLSRLLGFDEADLLSQFSKKYGDPYERKILKRNLNEEEISKISEYAYQLPGVFVQAGIDRQYTLGIDTSHVLGYVGEISQEQLDRMRDGSFKAGDFIGQYGLEKQYDDFLRGKSGGYQVEVDALGHQRKILRSTDMIPGNSLVLTIDQSIQEACSAELGDQDGAVIAMNPKNGEVLALVSKPGFDSDDLPRYLRSPYKERKPFLNRAIAGQYPPGSIFKIITEIAGLESGEITEHDRIECTGTVEIGDRIFHCWKEDGHGWVDIDEALPYSCNIFFGTLGTKVGVKQLLDYATLFELGKPTGVDLPGEKSGNIPGPDESGGAVNVAIGQGAVNVTPIQLCCLLSTIANGGNVWTPFIVQKIVDPRGQVIKSFSPVLRKTVFISDDTLTILRKGLENVVAFGTGAGARVQGIAVAGKTGTAQTAQSELGLPTHGAFACYAPADRPTIALVVFLDRASSAQAARIAGAILSRVLLPQQSETTGVETDKVESVPSNSDASGGVNAE